MCIRDRCTVALTQSAPNGGASVTLTSSNSVLTVPASVTVASGATGTTFTATTATIHSDSTAIVTATYNSFSVNTNVGLAAVVVGLANPTLLCNPSTLGPNASATCTVTLPKAAPSGGVSFTLTSSNSALTVPASVTIPAAATIASFSKMCIRDRPIPP